MIKSLKMLENSPPHPPQMLEEKITTEVLRTAKNESDWLCH